MSKELSTVLSDELPRQMIAMTRKLAITQLYNAFRQALSKQDCEELLDNIVLLAAAEIWQRMENKKGEVNAAEHR